jgi:hypothetical protein
MVTEYEFGLLIARVIVVLPGTASEEVIVLHAKTGFDTVAVAVFDVIISVPSDARAFAEYTTDEPGGPLTVADPTQVVLAPLSNGLDAVEQSTETVGPETLLTL